MRFADFDDSAAKQGYCPGVVGAAWVCEEHLLAALEVTHMPVESAVSHLRKSIGVENFAFSEGLTEPHLFVDDAGPNRLKVFAILRAATEMTPQQAKDAIEHLPVLVAKGWPTAWKTWEKQLRECGAAVRVAWD